jgi:hypothetical protein
MLLFSVIEFLRHVKAYQLAVQTFVLMCTMAIILP